jgi:hypothetical protein
MQKSLQTYILFLNLLLQQLVLDKIFTCKTYVLQYGCKVNVNGIYNTFTKGSRRNKNKIFSKLLVEKTKMSLQ